VSLKPLAALALPPGSDGIAQPLPAEEQLAPLLRLVEAKRISLSDDDGPPHSPQSLADAYIFCRRLIRRHSKSFFFSTQFLPAEKRSAVRAFYAFCRTTDDTVDDPSDDPAHALANWIYQVRAVRPDPQNPVLLAWHDTRARYRVPGRLENELLAGVAMDLSIKRYASFADLWLYCYRVASVVGLISMNIIGYADGAAAYAIKLGVALQLTNIMQGRYDGRFRGLMRFQIARARRLYAESLPGIALLPSDSRFGVAAAGIVYRRILDKIEQNNYDVFARRAYVPLSEKLQMLPGIWRTVQRVGRS
jgi:phytoene synthase